MMIGKKAKFVLIKTKNKVDMLVSTVQNAGHNCLDFSLTKSGKISQTK